MKNLVLVFVFIAFLSHGETANILGLFGCASHSHFLWNEVLVGALSERGHSLTVVSVDENKSPKPNVTHLHMEKTYDTIFQNLENTIDGVKQETLPKPSGIFSNIQFLYLLKMYECKGILESRGFQDVLKLNEKFDLILYDTETGPCMLRLIERYPNVPVVGVTAFKMDPRVVEMVGGHSYPGYISHILKKHEMPKNFWKRLDNVVTYAYAYLYRKFVSDRYIEDLTSLHIPGPKAPLDNLYERIKISLVNTHPSMDYAQSLPPNIIEVGGLHIKQPKPLPSKIQIFLDSAVKGSVLISLGSNIKAEVLGKQRIEDLISVIKRFPEYNFLWKVEDKGILKEFPKNLMIQNWLPQNDILAHPKLKVFFTHAGGLSMQEAVFHGKPLVAMPFFVDQMNNAFLAEHKGYGKVVLFEEINEESVYSAFSEVFNNSSYSRNMLELQKKFLDRKSKPLDTAIWWIEYILRNPKADHLSPFSRNMTYLVANSFDIVLVFYCLISLILFVGIFISFKLFKNILNKFMNKLDGKYSNRNKVKNN
ncbi:UDP-glucosyltransferase 2-like [Eupeodes corollae]|uniref:UDP-glucosyltransferase 2-like n=1 Tax=Eupeodes corollae TaxID=290404 RepID=UPI002492B58A|nr:UDP-glucosyltransferase 2-like [Eupeodes corollae]